MSNITINIVGNWKLWWGNMPLPAGSEAIGTIQTGKGQGALIRLQSGQYVQGNAGEIRNLPQKDITKILTRGVAWTR